MYLSRTFPQPKATPAGPSTAPAQPVQPAQPIQPPQPAQPTITEPAPDPVEPTAEQPTETPTSSGSSSGFLTGPALETAITNMIDMGFTREEVQRAMRASFNNPDRAVEYLMTVS
jgi:UV excision repair protein RAD23